MQQFCLFVFEMTMKILLIFWRGVETTWFCALNRCSRDSKTVFFLYRHSLNTAWTLKKGVLFYLTGSFKTILYDLLYDSLRRGDISYNMLWRLLCILITFRCLRKGKATCKYLRFAFNCGRPKYILVATALVGLTV